MNKLLLAGLLVVVAAQPCRTLAADDADPNPIWRGKRLSDWTTSLREGSDDERRLAAEAIGELGPRAKIAVPELIQALKDKDILTQSAASRALGKIGEPAARTHRSLESRG